MAVARGTLADRMTTEAFSKVHDGTVNNQENTNAATHVVSP